MIFGCHAIFNTFESVTLQIKLFNIYFPPLLNQRNIIRKSVDFTSCLYVEKAISDLEISDIVIDYIRFLFTHGTTGKFDPGFVRSFVFSNY